MIAKGISSHGKSNETHIYVWENEEMCFAAAQSVENARIFVFKFLSSLEGCSQDSYSLVSPDPASLHRRSSFSVRNDSNSVTVFLTSFLSF